MDQLLSTESKSTSTLIDRGNQVHFIHDSYNQSTFDSPNAFDSPHPSYDNAACAGSVISTACHPPSRFEESLTSTLPSMVGRDQEAAPKPDGRTQSNTTSILLASTPSMPPSWSMTDPSGRPLFADCQRSNPSMALKSSKSMHHNQQ